MEKRAIRRRQVFAHVPWRHLRKNLDLVLRRGVQPEVYLSSEDLRELEKSEGARVAQALRERGLGCTFHAPFMDLNPGALDREVRAITLERFRQILAAAVPFAPRAIVFHPGYDRWRYDGQVEQWLNGALETFAGLLETAGDLLPDTMILAENIFESEPGSLRDLLDLLANPRMGICFDCGHYQLFGSEQGLRPWMEALGERIFELHLHDNDGTNDAHAPPGTGKFPFDELFGHLEACGKLERLLTLEAHSREDLDRSLAWLGEKFALEEE